MKVYKEWRNEKITIIGLGLIGGSLAMALKKKGFKKLTGFSRSKETMSKAKKLGAVNKIAFSYPEAVKDSTIVILAVPISEMKKVFLEIKGHLKEGCIVTDVASTKKQIVRLGEQILPPWAKFIGGHPMAGKETSGIENADAGLFEEKAWCLIPTKLSNRNSLSKLKSLLKSTGARPVVIKAHEHDSAVAGISHLPAIVASALLLSASRNKSWPIKQKLASGGFRDTTRLASDNITMRTDFSVSNRDSVLNELDKFSAQLEKFRSALREKNTGNLRQMFSQAKNKRDKLFAERE